MNSKLRALIAISTIITAGGVRYYYATRTPPETTMADLRDAGAVVDRVARWVYCAAESLDKKTRRQLLDNGYGDFRIDSVHRICRVVWQYDNIDVAYAGEDASVALSVSTTSGQDSGTDEGDGGEDSLGEIRIYGGGYRLNCNDDIALAELRLLPDAGFRYTQSPGVEDPFCSAQNRPGRVTPPCAIPNCWTLSDGGWDDSAVVDCQKIDPPSHLGPGGPRWAGCNVINPGTASVGAACLPVECSVVAGDDPIQVLR